ncbi:hypothetical protein YYC_05054 [Plasmodium yoelii 17X]|uniref:Uncharacterized protein n=1 Tax=Plasmodium yoelii 17X TaxID=1323249 RepID=V7PFY7_PLAYE|nr:hypothetical protein YYC_05054 [Plasmodium yoelii 17X]
MSYSKHLRNIYLNIYIKRANIPYLSPLKGQYINLIKHISIIIYMYNKCLTFTKYYFKNNLHLNTYLSL